MTEQITTFSPSELLAQQITERFIREKLVPEKYSSEIRKILLSQVTKPEDWQLVVEKILEIETKGA